MLEQYETARLEPPKKDILRKAIDAIRGLFAFAAEQIVAMSISKASIDLGNLWLRQRRTIGATKGLTFERGGDTFDDIGGLSHLKEFGGIFTGSRPPQAVCRLDELEKMTTGATGQVGDTSGISHDALGMDLRIIQDRHRTTSRQGCSRSSCLEIAPSPRRQGGRMQSAVAAETIQNISGRIA